MQKLKTVIMESRNRHTTASVEALGCAKHVLSAFLFNPLTLGFPGGSDAKESACNAGDSVSILGSGRSPGEGNVNPLQYSCLGNPMDRGGWWAIVHRVTKSRTRLSDYHTNPGRASIITPIFQMEKLRLQR